MPLKNLIANIKPYPCWANSREIAKINRDYGFKIGNFGRVTERLPVYRERILEFQKKLPSSYRIDDHNHTPMTKVVDELGKTLG